MRGGEVEELTRRTARRLGWDPRVLDAAARRLYARGLREERDARAAAFDGRTQQAIRGHVTRALIAEVVALLNELQRQ